MPACSSWPYSRAEIQPNILIKIVDAETVRLGHWRHGASSHLSPGNDGGWRFNTLNLYLWIEPANKGIDVGDSILRHVDHDQDLTGVNILLKCFESGIGESSACHAG